MNNRLQSGVHSNILITVLTRTTADV